MPDAIQTQKQLVADAENARQQLANRLFAELTPAIFNSDAGQARFELIVQEVERLIDAKIALAISGYGSERGQTGAESRGASA